MKKYVLIFINFMMILSIFGCTNKNDIYKTDDRIVYQSSEDAYDYSYSLNEGWYIDKQDKEITSYVNDKNEVKLSFIKIGYDNETYGTSLESKDLPLLFSDYADKEIDFTKLREKETRTDYHGEFKFRYSKGQLEGKKYQLIYFLTDHIIPSVSGKKVANCIVATYTDEDDKNINQFIIGIENTIHYE